MLRSDLCDYSDIYIYQIYTYIKPVVKGNTTRVIAACQNTLMIWHAIVNHTP